MKHPDGTSKLDVALTDVSLNPILTAAAAHNVASPINVLPLTLASMHLPVVGRGYPNPPTSNVRQDPPPTVA